MHDERSNESFHWKGKLDELNDVPQSGAFDKGAAWEKLHGRMGKTRHSRKFLWYWSAAACLFLFVGMQLFRMSPDKHIVKKDEQQQGKPSDPKIFVSEIKDTLLRSAKIVVQKKHRMVEKKIVDSKQKAEKIIATQEHVVPSQVSTGVVDTLADIIEQQDAAAIVVLPPVKKKLRVVHINDLDNPWSENNHFSQLYKAPYFKTRLNQNVLPDLTVSRNNSDNIIRIKLSPSN